MAFAMIVAVMATQPNGPDVALMVCKPRTLFEVLGSESIEQGYLDRVVDASSFERKCGGAMQIPVRCSGSHDD